MSASLPLPWSGYMTRETALQLIEGVASPALQGTPSRATQIAHGVMSISQMTEEAYQPMLYTHQGIASLPHIEDKSYQPVGHAAAPILYFMLCGMYGTDAEKDKKCRCATAHPDVIREAITKVTDTSFYLSGLLVMVAEGAYVFTRYKTRSKTLMMPGGNVNVAREMTDKYVAGMRSTKTPKQIVTDMKGNGLNIRFVPRCGSATSLLDRGIEFRRGQKMREDGDSMSSSSSYSSSSSQSNQNINTNPLLSVDGPSSYPPQTFIAPPSIAHPTSLTTSLPNLPPVRRRPDCPGVDHSHVQTYDRMRSAPVVSAIPPNYAIESYYTHIAPGMGPDLVKWMATSVTYLLNVLGPTEPTDPLGLAYRIYFMDEIARSRETTK